MYRGCIPNSPTLALCSNEAHSGSFSRNLFHFHHYNISYINIKVDGTPTPSEPLAPIFAEGTSTSCYATLFDDKRDGNTSKKEYLNGYCIVVFRLQSQTGCDLVSSEKSGNLSVTLKFAEPLQENVPAILYAKFPKFVTVNGVRNIDFAYKS